MRRSAQRLPSSSAGAGGGKYWEEVSEAPNWGPEPAPQAPAIPPSEIITHFSFRFTLTSQHRLHLRQKLWLRWVEIQFGPRQCLIVDVEVSLVDGTHPLPRLPCCIFWGVKWISSVDVELFEGGGEEEAVSMQVHPGRQHIPESTIMNYTCTRLNHNVKQSTSPFSQPINLPLVKLHPRLWRPLFPTVGEISNDGVSKPMAVNPQLVTPPRHRGQQHLTHCSVSHSRPYWERIFDQMTVQIVRSSEPKQGKTQWQVKGNYSWNDTFVAGEPEYSPLDRTTSLVRATLAWSFWIWQEIQSHRKNALKGCQIYASQRSMGGKYFQQNDNCSTLSQLGSSGQHIRCSQDASFPDNWSLIQRFWAA